MLLFISNSRADWKCLRSYQGCSMRTYLIRPCLFLLLYFVSEIRSMSLMFIYLVESIRSRVLHLHGFQLLMLLSLLKKHFRQVNIIAKTLQNLQILLSVLSDAIKIFEKFINDKLAKKLGNIVFFLDFQFAFVVSHLTMACLTILTTKNHVYLSLWSLTLDIFI